jgi:hypothetical protein
MESLGIQILAKELNPVSPGAEPALLALRISPFWVATQFHPETNPAEMKKIYSGEKKVQEVQERKDYHHLGSPDVNDVFYHKDNMEMTIIFRANGSNTTFLNKMDKVEHGDELYLGLLGDIRRFDNKIGVGVGLNYKKQNEAYTISFTTNQISLGLYKKLF